MSIFFFWLLQTVASFGELVNNILMTKLLIRSDVAFSDVRKVVWGLLVILTLTFSSVISLVVRETSVLLFKTLIRLREALPFLNGTEKDVCEQ